METIVKIIEIDNISVVLTEVRACPKYKIEVTT